MMHPNIRGDSIALGNSEATLDKKYELTEYILLLTSLKNTGLSSGKTRITFYMDVKAMIILIKKRAPFLF